MGWFLSLVVYAIIWWTALFAVLPIGIRPDAQGDPEAGGWRGAPTQPRILQKVIITTIVASILWLGVYLLIESNWISFRDPWLSIPD
jgi:predicted secreted protein